MEIAKVWGVITQNSKTLEPIDKNFVIGDYFGDDSLHAKIHKWLCYCRGSARHL